MSAETTDTPRLNVNARAVLVALILIAVAPWLLLALPGHQMTVSPFQMLATLNVAHVGTTAFFWFDRRYKAHIGKRPAHFYALPAAVAVLSLGTVAMLGPAGYALLLAINTMWLTYHFAKQNWGILCLSATATGAERPAVTVKYLYAVGSLGGAVGILLPSMGNAGCTDEQIRAITRHMSRAVVEKYVKASGTMADAAIERLIEHRGRKK